MLLHDQEDLINFDQILNKILEYVDNSYFNLGDSYHIHRRGRKSGIHRCSPRVDGRLWCHIFRRNVAH